MPVSPEEMAMMQQQAGKQTGGGATKLAQDVAKGLSELSDMLDQSKGATDQDKQQMQQIIQSFVDLVEKKLGGEPGQDVEDPAEQMGEVPMTAGVKGKPLPPGQ